MRVNELSGAWEVFNRIFDDTSREKVELYDIYYEISTKLFEYRIEKKWSQKKLAEVLGITQAMVSKLESGDYNYTVEQLWKISKKLGWKLNINFTSSDNIEQFNIWDEVAETQGVYSTDKLVLELGA